MDLMYIKRKLYGMHSWHGKGGGGYGAGVSLRDINLTLNEIINVIKCGRPGTGMPYFSKKAYKEENVMILLSKIMMALIDPCLQKNF